MSIIFFHNPDEENGYLSNWYLSSFVTNGITFSSAEQYMMHAKATLFNDLEAANQILATDDVRKIKQLGREVKDYDDKTWNESRQSIVYAGLLEKFRQNEELRSLLKGTGDAILAEAAVNDCVWGIGLSMKDHKRFDQSKWRGRNLLGYTLMQVRETL